MKRAFMNPRLKPDIWPDAAIFPSNLKPMALRWAIRGDYGPLTTEEREACQYWLALRTMEGAAGK